MSRWEMFGYTNDRGTYTAVGDRRYVRLHGCDDPQPVAVVEDPGGDYKGWINWDEETPVMIQHHRIFEIQFPYGSAAEVEVGRGRVVPLRVEQIGGE